MKSSEKKIYEEAFKLFLVKNYELVTIKDIEKATKKTRGAIFYYVRDKEELYRKIIDEYILTKQNLYYKINLPSNPSLFEFINLYVEGVQKVADQIYDFLGADKSDLATTTNIEKSYISLVLNTERHYPSFNEKIREIFSSEIETWKDVVQKAIHSGEINPELDSHIVACQFRYMFLGSSLSDSLNNGLDIAFLRQTLLDFYKLLLSK